MEKKKSYEGGLVVTRRPGEAVYIRTGGVEIRVDVREVQGVKVRVGILADAELVEIRRDDAVKGKDA